LGARASLAALITVSIHLASAPRAHAHKPSDSYLTLRVEGAAVVGRWDIALRDLEFAVGLDADGDGTITWGELFARRAAVLDWALARLQVASEGAACPLQPGALKVCAHSDGAYAVLAFQARCPEPPARLAVEYRLLFDVDAQHRGLLRVTSGETSRSSIFSIDEPRRTFEFSEAGSRRPEHHFAAFVRDGMRHIFGGVDHILFLLALLLPAVLRRDAAGRWRAAANLRPVTTDVLRIVTSFTVAHSLTLAVSALGLFRLPQRPVEVAIAVSVALAALNNVSPVFGDRRWTVAFGFGLLHGFGFASALADLGGGVGVLPALVGFNLGVEAGQLVIVAAFLPLAFALRHSWTYQRLTLWAGSLGIAALAVFWSIQRLLG
jgi:hypothetical protein